MAKSTAEITFMEISTPESRLDFIFSTFSISAIYGILEKTIRGDKDLGERWASQAVLLAKASLFSFAEKRDSGSLEGSRKEYVEFASVATLAAIVKEKASSPEVVSHIQAYLSVLPEYNPKVKKQAAAVLEHHGYLLSAIQHCLDVVLKKLHGRDTHSGHTRPLRKGDVVAEGPGFEVVAGHKLQNVVRYSEGRTGIVLMHDPRDGHFILVERYSDVDGGFVLEFPKALASSMSNKETAAAIALRDLTGLALRDLEKIGEIRPDTHMIDGVCDVFYGIFDLEENYHSTSKLVRDVKRINEEGLNQAAFERKITCAQTLSAISIWRAFETVRKKRVANSRRVRTPKGAIIAEPVDTESDEE
jgi:hypothetical protein